MRLSDSAPYYSVRGAMFIERNESPGPDERLGTGGPGGRVTSSETGNLSSARPERTAENKRGYAVSNIPPMRN